MDPELSKGKACVSRFPLIAFCTLQVCLHMHLGKSRWTSVETFFCHFSSSKHVHEKLQLLIYHTATLIRLRKLLDAQQYISYWGGVTPPASISAHPAPAEPSSSRLSFCVSTSNAFCLHLWIISFFIQVLHRLSWAICCNAHWKSSSLHNSHSWIKKLRTDSELMRAQE